jgi:hypothetical protein
MRVVVNPSSLARVGCPTQETRTQAQVFFNAWIRKAVILGDAFSLLGTWLLAIVL